MLYILLNPLSRKLTQYDDLSILKTRKGSCICVGLYRGYK